MSLWIMWLIAAALLLVLELITGWIATFCVGMGCLVASVMDIAGCSLQWQLAGVVVGVILAFIFLAPFVNRLRKSRAHTEAYNSNMDALIGREIPVERPIPANGLGRVRIDGDSWQARSSHGEPVESGVNVKVTGYDSIILIVKPI
ncbi:NfeD family protein [uncultured Muribaculum sp.]|uniref:NfeD family protein n=1 Tax=uncultured Muribaculum sp. TaxID=1918613 RepID=UPI002592E48A|nr:NfeD family protein [uncultured Muribaculum sp.]